MTFRYRLHVRGLALALPICGALAAAAALGLRGPWRALAAAPVAAMVAATLAWRGQRDRAHRLGSVLLEDEAVRRVRGDGRVVEVLRWEEMRSVVVDRRLREVLFQGPDGTSLWCEGAPFWGGVGLERFDEFLSEIRRRAPVPLREVRRSRWERRPREKLARQQA